MNAAKLYRFNGIAARLFESDSAAFEYGSYWTDSDDAVIERRDEHGNWNQWDVARQVWVESKTVSGFPKLIAKGVVETRPGQFRCNI